MIKDFGNRVALDIYKTGVSKKLPRELWKRAIYLLDLMEALEDLKELEGRGFPPSLRLHKLKGNRKGEYAIDINKVSGWRITFEFENGEFSNVKIEDYH